MIRYPELKGKELGNMIFSFKAKFENFEEFILSNTIEEIYIKFDEHKKGNF